jgi:hypothetical protein
MRTFEIPPPETVSITNQQTKQRGEPEEYSFDRLHMDHVWGHVDWRKTSDAIEARERCVDAIVGKPPGTEVTLTEEDFDIYKPIATLKEMQISGDFSLALPRLMRPILGAKSSKEENGKATAAKDKKKGAAAKA